MKLTINQNQSVAETEIVITCNEMDSETAKIIQLLQVFNKKLSGTKNNKTFIIEASDVLYFDTVDKKSFIYTATEIYETTLKLYEIEDKMKAGFFRISKSAIINLNQVKSLEPDFGSRLIATLINGEKLFISRQYVPIIKKQLGL